MTTICPQQELDAALRQLARPAVATGSEARDAAGIVWITGLSGVGKSTLAQRVVGRLRADGDAVAWLDGDALRRRPALCGAGYDSDSRRALALQYSALAASIAATGFCVVVSTISLQHAVHAANRAHGVPYLEVWLRAEEALRLRRAADRTGGPRVGSDVLAQFPAQPHLALDNDDSHDTIARLAERVIQAYRDVRSAGRS